MFFPVYFNRYQTDIKRKETIKGEELGDEGEGLIFKEEKVIDID